VEYNMAVKAKMTYMYDPKTMKLSSVADEAVEKYKKKGYVVGKPTNQQNEEHLKNQMKGQPKEYVEHNLDVYRSTAKPDNDSMASGYTGLDADELSKAWLEKMKSGIEESANSQINTIKQNLAEVLSSLDAEKASAQTQNTKQLDTIHNNEFATSETQKELMNQSGWNPTNSGLAVGELGKIKIGADKERADANAALVEALNDIARRATLANTHASNDTANVKNWKDAQLSGAEAQALLYADQIGYDRYRDTVADAWNQQNFNYQKERDAVSDAWNQQNFDYQKDIDTRNFDYEKFLNDRNYNYQVSRDKVLDEQWLKQFNSQEQQRLIDNAIKNRQISIDEGQLALQRAAQAWARDPNNPDNRYKNAQIEAMKSSNNNDNTVGPLYNSMMNSSDPEAWLKENSKYLTNDELNTLYNLYYKSINNKDPYDSLN
jgi:hypothetical protein